MYVQPQFLPTNIKYKQGIQSVEAIAALHLNEYHLHSEVSRDPNPTSTLLLSRFNT
jgi:sporulation-control protein spo0M